MNDKLTIVIGLGKTGLSCVDYLHSHDIPFMVMDTRESPPGIDEFQRKYPHIHCMLGEFDQAQLAKAKEIVVSPGIDSHLSVFDICREKNIPLVGDIDLFARVTNAPIIGITGTNGKSTVTAMLADMCAAADLNVGMGGNIGKPVLDLLRQPTADIYVIELSSYQLETCPSLKLFAGTVLNVSPDHMDRYDSYQSYQMAKQSIYSKSEHWVANRNDWQIPKMINYQNKTIFSFGDSEPDESQFGLKEFQGEIYLMCGNEKIIATTELYIKGRHNWMNALAVSALAHSFSIPMLAMKKALIQFKGLAHRMQWIGEWDDIHWYNDSKGTNVGACLASISGLSGTISGELILIAGGQAKDQDFSDLCEPVKQSVRHAILFGEDAEKMQEAFEGSTDITLVKSLAAAVEEANDRAIAGDAVLFSPACVSFDMFRNFEHRGEAFIDIVRSMHGSST